MYTLENAHRSESCSENLTVRRSGGSGAQVADPVAMWSYNRDQHHFEYITADIERITGYASDEFHDFRKWLAIVHPADLPCFQDLYRKASMGSPGECEYRIIRADGRIRRVYTKIVSRRSSARRGGRVDGLLMDITNRKTSKETLRGQEQLMDRPPSSTIEDQSLEKVSEAGLQAPPNWLLRLMFQISENGRKRLSQDLHDAVLQDQMALYRYLNQVLTDEPLAPEAHKQLEAISQGLLDVIYQIRLVCNDLRPPLLKEEGLVSSLESLFEHTQLRSDYSILFDANVIYAEIAEDHAIGLYRIVQELLANASKHSGANQVTFRLLSTKAGFQLIYKDNGIGMDTEKTGTSSVSMGLRGIKERVRSMNGTIVLQSFPNQGLSIRIHIPLSPKD